MRVMSAQMETNACGLAGVQHRNVKRSIIDKPGVKLLGAVALVTVLELVSRVPVSQRAFTAQQRKWTSASMLRSKVACRAESFDPFGWKGKFKDSLGGLMDALGDEEEPSQLEEQMVVEIFEKFDVDKDGFLNNDEFNTLQLATEGEEAVYNQEQLEQLLKAVNPDIEEPSRGMPFAEYRRLYLERRLRQSYSTDIEKDHMKIFGPGGPRGGPVVDAEVSSTAGTIALGSQVKIEGLTGAKELNGQTGNLVAPEESEAAMVAEGGVIVQLGDGERLALKPANVVAV